MSGLLIPAIQPITVNTENTEMERCKFALINFPSTWGQQDIYVTKNGHNYVTQHFKLRASTWQVEITGVDSLMGIHHKMEREGGSAITHFGSITSSDGQSFSADRLDSLLEALHLFLSFARGSYCGLGLLSGQDSSGNRVWQKWGTYKTEPWSRELLTWNCLGHSESLSDVFEGFWHLFGDPKWNETLVKVTAWYLRSNDANESEVSIVLTQAALEHLTYKLQGTRGATKEGDWIASALNGLGIDVPIPPECRELSKLENQLNWSHGPHALVAIRNSLIHADNKLGNISPSAYTEAWNLGQRYIELMILKLCNYAGQYRNRLKWEAGYTPSVETVPWASEH